MLKASELNELASKAVKCSLAHGYKDNEYPAKRLVIKTICEIGEIISAKRDNRICNLAEYRRAINYSRTVNYDHDRLYEEHVKDTVQDEFADVAVYILLTAGHFGVTFSTTELEKAVRCSEENDWLDAEKDFVLRAGYVIECIQNTVYNTFSMSFKLAILELWLKLETGENLWFYVKEKMEYNRKRPYLHGHYNDNTK